MTMTENSLRQPLRYEVDLSTGLVQTPLRTQLMKGDKQANTIIVKLTNGSESVDLTGVEVTGSFISPVESAELPLPGEAIGDEARVTLLDQCYAEDGFFECSVKLKLGGTERTILSIAGNVLSKGSGAYIDVGDVIPSIDDIIAQYAEMKKVTEDVQAAAGLASTEAGNANTAAGKANAAAAKIDNMTVSAADGTSAGATISEKNGAMHIDFTLPKGEKGDKGDKGDPGQNGTGSGTVTGVKVDGQTYQPDGTGVVTLPKMGGGAEVDDTLTQEGKAADAKKTGDALNQLSEQIENLDVGGLKSDPAEDESTEAPDMGSVPINADQLGGMTYQQIVDLIYPVGRTITTLADSDNPNTLYPWQTWERTAKGRMFIGTGAPENNDDGTSPGSYNYALGSKGGEEKHKLTVNEMPSHRHDGVTITGLGIVWEGVFKTGNDKHGVNTGGSGSHGDFSTIFEGGDQPHNNMSPYIAANIWKRVK